MPVKPRFSVTVPAYNAAATLPDTVASVQAQTFPDWELVIVDDGSSDDTLSVARALAADESRINVVTQPNTGTGGAYNTAVREAKSDLLVMLSADDLLLPEHLAGLDPFISQRDDCSIFSTAGYFEYPDGTRERTGLPDVWAEPRECTMANLLQASFYAVGAVYRRAVFDAVGGFKQGAYVEDYAFWLGAVARGYRHAYLDTATAVHRRSDQQKSADVIGVRESERRSIEEVLDAGVLSDGDAELAKAAMARIDRNIRNRRMLSAVLGTKGTESVERWVRSRRS